VALRKKYASAGLKVWTVADLGAFYTEHRSELVAHASRILKDSARAEEVIQDALIKVMLAAPELESADHALGYMHRTIENLCIDIFRIEGRRPNLVVLDDASAELDSTWVDNKDHADVISAAEDAAIVRQALPCSPQPSALRLLCGKWKAVQQKRLQQNLESRKLLCATRSLAHVHPFAACFQSSLLIKSVA